MPLTLTFSFLGVIFGKCGNVAAHDADESSFPFPGFSGTDSLD